MDAEATILNLRRASARERMARIRAKKKEARHVADMIRERKAIAIAADRQKASARERAARSYAKKKEVEEWIRECEAIAVAADCQRAIAVAADRRRASARERAARSYAKKKEARHAAVGGYHLLRLLADVALRGLENERSSALGGSGSWSSTSADADADASYDAGGESPPPRHRPTKEFPDDAEGRTFAAGAQAIAEEQGCAITLQQFPPMFQGKCAP